MSQRRTSPPSAAADVDILRAPSRDALKKQFLGVVSHELRTPLTSIGAFAEMLSAGDLPAGEHPAALAAVKRNTTRMLAVVEDLTLLAQLESAERKIAATTVRLTAVVAEAGWSVRKVVPSAVVAGKIEDGPPILGDEPLLRQLFYAVIGTVAARTMDCSAEIDGESRDGHWTVSVHSSRVKPLTDEYFLATQLPVPGEEQSRSLALWMLLARAIARRHGGAIGLRSDQAAGSAITVRLPISRAPAAEAG